MDGLLCRFPVLEEEVPGLLQRVAAGERVVVSGLEVTTNNTINDQAIGRQGLTDGWV